jgi:hypothetical protein
MPYGLEEGGSSDPYNFYDSSAPGYQDPYNMYGIYDVYGGQEAYEGYEGNTPSYGYGEDFMAQMSAMGLDPSIFNSLFGQMRQMDPYSELLTGTGGNPASMITMETMQQMYDMGLDPNNQGVIDLFQQTLGIDPDAPAPEGTDYKSILGGAPKYGGGGMSRKALAAMAKNIMETMANPGMDKEVMADARGAINAAAKGRERSLLERHASSQASRGMFRSGVTREGQLDISDKVSEQIFDEMNKLEMQNAQIAEQALARAFQGTLGMGDLDMRRMQTQLSGSLGFKNLKLQELQMNMKNAIEQMLLNLGIGSQYSGNQ